MPGHLDGLHVEGLKCILIFTIALSLIFILEPIADPL